MRWLNQGFCGADYLYNKNSGNRNITVGWMGIFMSIGKKVVRDKLFRK